MASGGALSWEQITSVVPPHNKWRTDQALTVRVQGGGVVLHVPDTLREEFVVYAEKHRKRAQIPPHQDTPDRPSTG